MYMCSTATVAHSCHSTCEFVTMCSACVNRYTLYNNMASNPDWYSLHVNSMHLTDCLIETISLVNKNGLYKRVPLYRYSPSLMHAMHGILATLQCTCL